MSLSINSSAFLISTPFLCKKYFILDFLVAFPLSVLSQSGKTAKTSLSSAYLSKISVNISLVLVQKCLVASGLLGFNEYKSYPSII